jgi:hypothetical protein
MRKILSYYKMLLIAVMAVTMVATFSDNTASASHAGNEVCDVTGHCYEVVTPLGGVNWTDARDAAAAMTHNGVSGHLATLTSTAETDFVAQNVPGAVGNTYNYFGGYRVGITGNNWAWVTGEAWDYTNWSPGEPTDEYDNSMPLLVTEFFHNGGGGGYAYLGQWNDQNGTQLRGYVVEYDAPAVAQTLDLDARIHGAAPPTYVSTSGVLLDGADYLVEIEGNWSAWLPGTLAAHVHADSVLYTSPSVPTGVLAGLDGSYRYEVGQYQAAINIGYSFDGGATVSALPRPLNDVYNPDHVYQYIITGEGKPASFRHGDTQGDNHGVMKVSIAPITPQSVTFRGGVLGADPAGITLDDFVEYYNEDTGEWQPANLVGHHPWGFVPGTDSWINCGPALDNSVWHNHDGVWSPPGDGYSCEGETSLYRLKFDVPAGWSDATLDLDMKADNYGTVLLNGAPLVARFTGNTAGIDVTTSVSLPAGPNELRFVIEDLHGLAGFNFLAVISGLAAAPIEVIEPDSDGDGIPNGDDPDPNDPCVPVFCNEPPVVDADVDVSNTVYYVDWTDANSAAGTASGVIVLPNGDVIDVDLSTDGGTPLWGVQHDGIIDGSLASHVSNPYDAWPSTATAYTSLEVPNAPPSNEIVTLSGGSATEYTVTLSEPIVDPIMAILSLGRGGHATTYDFDTPFTIVSQGSGAHGGCGTCLEKLSGDVLSGEEGHGTLRFDGTMSTFSWTVPTPENWHGFTFAVRTSAELERTVVVDEGETAANTGTWSDPNIVDGDEVDVTASVGTITQDANGTWSWSLDTTDGPDQSQTVTVTATDSFDETDTATFELVVNNVAPTVDADDATVTVDEGQTANNSGTFGDVGDDTVGLSASIGDVNDNGDGTWSWSYDSLDGPDETQTVTITATDSDTASTEATFELVVNNVAPTADAGGPYSGDEGTLIALSGSGGDVDADTLKFAWDLDGDNIFEKLGQNVNFDAVDDVTAQVVRLRVRDGDGGETIVSSTVTVNNVAPVIDSATSVLVGADVDVEVEFSDVGTQDTHVVTVNWGDGSSEGVAHLNGEASASHSFLQFGTYDVTVTVTDDDTGSATSDVMTLIVGGGACDCTEGVGWWKHQYKGNGEAVLTQEQIDLLALMVGSQSAYFSGLTVEGARDVFDPAKSNNKGGERNGSKSGRNDASATGSSRGKGKKKGHDNNSKHDDSESGSESLYRLSKFEEKSAQHVLAAWLNFAKGAVDSEQAFTVDGVDYTFTTLMLEVESLLSGEPTKADLNKAKKLAEAVNSLDKGNEDCDTVTGGSKSGSGSKAASGSDSGTGSAAPRGKK